MALAGYRAYVDVTFAASAIDEAPPFAIVYLSDLPADWHTAMSNADDTDGRTIRVTKDDGTTECAVYPVGIDTASDTGAIFFKPTDISISVDTVYRIWVGNASATMYATTDTYGRNAVFADYAGFYLPGVTLTDLTGNGRDLTAVNSPGTAASGYEGIDAATYNGSSQYHYYSGTLGVTDLPLTQECLVSMTSLTTSRIFCLANYASASNYSLLDYFSGGLRITMQGNAGSGSTASTSGLGAASTSTNYYLAGSRDSYSTGTTRSYRNGAAGATNTTNLTASYTLNSLSIGALRFNSKVQDYLPGNIAAAYISASVRSADYMATMHEVWNGTAYTAGTAQSVDGTTGWIKFQTASATTASGSHADWANPNNALSFNADIAQASLNNSTLLLSETLNLTNPLYGVTIPSGMTYTVKYRIRRAGQTGGGRSIIDYLVKMIDDTGAQVGDNLASASTWPSSGSYANADYTVTGYTPTASSFDADTGMALRVECDGADLSTSAYVQTVWMMVEWAASSGITGDGDLTLPALDISGDGGVVVSGDGALDFPAVTLAGAGGVVVSGSGDLELPVLEIAGSGISVIGGSGALLFPALDLSGTGGVVVGGTGALTLPATRLSGSGDAVIAGSGDIGLPALGVDGVDAPPTTTTDWFLFQNVSVGASNGGSVRAWSNAPFALTENLDSAYVGLGGGGGGEFLSAELMIRNPIGISIPPQSRITSIDYRISRRNRIDLDCEVFDHTIRPIKNGVASGDDISEPGEWSRVSETEEITYSRGLMGLVWGANDFGSDFGISITIQINKTAFSDAGAGIRTVWGRINYAATDPITGSGELDLPALTLDTRPIPTSGTASLTLPLFTMKGHSYNALCACCEGYTMRTLIELRRMLVQQSGHLELVLDSENEDWGDNGADHFIQAGQRFCDDQFQYHKSEAWFYARLGTGESLVTFKNARIIKEVWLNYENGSRVMLERRTLNKIREEYGKPLLSEEDTGQPAYWVPAVLGLAPQQFDETALTFDASGITDHDLIMFGNHYPYKGIYVMPPADGPYTVEVKAEWYSHEMCEDSDVSFWSQYPELLLMAARRQMEIDLHRNSTGAKDFEVPLLGSLQKLEHNLTAEEWSGPTKVRGRC